MADYLIHHGVKGMRWGIRRFQKKNGQLTPAGKMRYDNKPSRKEMLEKKYIEQGLSKDEAKRVADKRVKTEKIVAAAAGITVAACAAYAANKAIRPRIDSIVKAGETLQRVEMANGGGKLHEVFYASKGRHDNARYEGMLGATRIQQTDRAYVMKLQAGADIKVASRNKAVDTFGDLYKNDPEFRDSVKKYVSKHFTGYNKVSDVNDMSPRNIKKMYENFNSSLIDIRVNKIGADKKFYDKLKSAGYSAVQDINDMKYSGYNARNPLIIFDKSDSIMVKTVKELKDGPTLRKALKESYKANVIEPFLTVAGPLSATVLTSNAVSMYRQEPTADDDYVNTFAKARS